MQIIFSIFLIGLRYLCGTMEETLDKKAEVISGMFDSIAGKYDRMNHGMSLGIDRWWRRRFIRRLSQPQSPGTVTLLSGARILDLACGTADLTKALAQKGYIVTGLDISAEMMEVGKVKCRNLPDKPQFILGSAEKIPFTDGTFDAVTIAFGLRNFDRRTHCLAEIRRVLKPGGQLFVLEFAVPKNRLWRALYLFYFNHAMRIVGKMVDSGKAYGYLVDSVLTFPRYEALCREFEAAGFRDAQYESYSGGIAVCYSAVK